MKPFTCLSTNLAQTLPRDTQHAVYTVWAHPNAFPRDAKRRFYGPGPTKRFTHTRDAPSLRPAPAQTLPPNTWYDVFTYLVHSSALREHATRWYLRRSPSQTLSANARRHTSARADRFPRDPQSTHDAPSPRSRPRKRLPQHTTRCLPGVGPPRNFPKRTTLCLHSPGPLKHFLRTHDTLSQRPITTQTLCPINHFPHNTRQAVSTARPHLSAPPKHTTRRLYGLALPKRLPQTHNARPSRPRPSQTLFPETRYAASTVWSTSNTFPQHKPLKPLEHSSRTHDTLSLRFRPTQTLSRGA